MNETKIDQEKYDSEYDKNYFKEFNYYEYLLRGKFIFSL